MKYRSEWKEFVDMKDFRQDTQNMRKRGDADHGKVAPARERAKHNPDYSTNFYSNVGHAAHGFKEKAERYLLARARGWNRVGDSHQRKGDIGYSAAGAIEGTDIEGGSRVRRSAPEV
ncbi:hypothetical protein [Nocardia pneumoniae]|uniref:hypothetical protein n=1 Tax=Nocardia pneumoniae TaxID=228601 RepID=UPI0012F66EE0|nr:hypothetical protein [Nocardia pneumoniae]